jgi:hypothetical protein
VHRQGDEAAWWQKLGFNPTGAARALWLPNASASFAVARRVLRGPVGDLAIIAL